MRSVYWGRFLVSTTREDAVEIVRRDNFSKETVKKNEIIKEIRARLNEIQNTLYLKAKRFQEENTTYVDNYDDFKETLNNKGGFIAAHWDGTNSTEEAIKKETKATIRCIPLDSKEEKGSCIYSGNPSNKRVLFAKAY